MKTSIIVLAGVLAGLVVSGCGGIVKKPEINSVKRIGIISVYSNSRLHYFHENKVIISPTPMDFAASALKLGAAVKNSFDKSSPLLEFARQSLEAEFKKLPQFQVIPFEEFGQNPAYRNLSVSTGKPMFQNKTLTIGSMISTPPDFDIAPGMKAIEGLAQSPVDRTLMTNLTNLAKDLNLDGVIVVRFELGYKNAFFTFHSLGSALAGSVSGGRTVSAVASVAATLRLITRQGNFGIVIPDFKDGEGSRKVSDKKFTIMDGKALMTDETVAAMRESILQAVVSMREMIAKEL